MSEERVVWPKPQSVWQHHENKDYYVISSISKFKENGTWQDDPLITYCKFQDTDPVYYSRYLNDFLASFRLRLS